MVAEKLLRKRKVDSMAQTSLLSTPTQTMTIDGVTIRYCIAGCGEPLLLIHGLGAMIEYWYKNIDCLAKHYQVIALDLPGFGQSDRPQNLCDVDVEYYINFLVHFLNALKVEQTHIVAHSFGGALALRFAEYYPERLKKLIL